MNWYIVTIEEFSGWECDGHDVPYIVAAHSEEEAWNITKPKDYPSYIKPDVKRLILPDLQRKKKPFVL